MLFIINTKYKHNINLEIEIRVINKHSENPRVNTSYALYDFDPEVMKDNNGKPEKTIFYKKIEVIKYLANLIKISQT